MEVYHLCEALEFAKRELFDFAIENEYDGLIKHKSFHPALTQTQGHGF